MSDLWKANSPSGMTIYVSFTFCGDPHGAMCSVCHQTPATISIFPMKVEEMVDKNYQDVRENVLPGSILWASEEFWLRRELKRVVGSGAVCDASSCYRELCQRRWRIFTSS